jgi:hypothetical protein
MRCNRCLPLIEQYFDGELDRRLSEQVSEHIANCSQCASEQERVRREQAFYLRLESDARASAEFWPGVSAKISEPERARPATLSVVSSLLERFASLRLSASLAALIVMIAVAITIAVMKQTNSKESAATRTDVAGKGDADSASVSAQPDNKATNDIEKIENRLTNKDTPASSRSRNARRSTGMGQTSIDETRLEKMVRQAEQKYLAAIQILSRDINRRRSRLDRETIAQLDQTLAAVDRTIRDTRKAARHNPGDPVAVQYMLAAYAKKVDLLKTITSD